MSAIVQDVMSTHVVAVRRSASFKEMAATLRAQRVSAFPVIDDDNRVIGVVSEADLLMYGSRVKRLPVVKPDGTLVGIVTRTDVLAVYDRKDTDIRDEIKEVVILRHHGCDPAVFTVTVTDGVVTLAGTPETAAVGRGIAAAVRHVQGVVAVRDRLTYPPAERPCAT